MHTFGQKDLHDHLFMNYFQDHFLEGVYFPKYHKHWVLVFKKLFNLTYVNDVSLFLKFIFISFSGTISIFVILLSTYILYFYGLLFGSYITHKITNYYVSSFIDYKGFPYLKIFLTKIYTYLKNTYTSCFCICTF